MKSPSSSLKNRLSLVRPSNHRFGCQRTRDQQLDGRTIKGPGNERAGPLGFIPFYSFGAAEGPSDTSMFVAESKIIRQLAKSVPASSSAAAATSSCATFPNTIPSLSAPTTISVPNAAGQNMTARPFRKSRLKTRNGPIITNTIRENVGDSLKNILYPSTLQKSPSTRQLT